MTLPLLHVIPVVLKSPESDMANVDAATGNLIVVVNTSIRFAIDRLLDVRNRKAWHEQQQLGRLATTVSEGFFIHVI